MPEVKDELGNKVAEFEYTPKGEAAADKMVADNPGYTTTDAMERSVKKYPGGGKVPSSKEIQDEYERKKSEKARILARIFNLNVDEIDEKNGDIS